VQPRRSDACRSRFDFIDVVDYDGSIFETGNIEMASITIRNLDDSIKSRLRMRAASHGRSMEEEARTILRTVLGQENASGINLVQCIRARFGPLGDVDLPQPEREGMREPPNLGG